jgi:hypothetical protein
MTAPLLQRMLHAVARALMETHGLVACTQQVANADWWAGRMIKLFEHTVWGCETDHQPALPEGGAAQVRVGSTYALQQRIHKGAAAAQGRHQPAAGPLC